MSPAETCLWVSLMPFPPPSSSSTFNSPDIVREIIENRSEIYKALNAEPEPADAEEASQPDIDLREHLKIKEEIAKMQAEAKDKATDNNTTPQQ